MINSESSGDAILFLLKKATDEEWSKIEESLRIAKQNAERDLDKSLFEALDWPMNRWSYIQYLRRFKKWIPQESGDPVWHDLDDNSQEVYDRLCHFYYLVNQETSKGVLAQYLPWFSNYLVEYAKQWGSFLDTQESFNADILQTFIRFAPKYRVQDSMVDGKPNAQWNSFNDFFARELNPGLRHIDSPNDNTIVTMPADCTFRQKFVIKNDSSIPEITIKKTHKVANIKELLEGSQYANSFANGTFVHYFLAPSSYHRFHVPVSGIVKECRPVQGFTYFGVKLSKGQFDAPDDATDGYEFIQARGVITIDTTNSPEGNIGVVAVLPIGMCQVSSVNMFNLSGKSIKKGDEFGYFTFGGSDIILLFQEGKSPAIDECINYRHYGTSISKCPSS